MSGGQTIGVPGMDGPDAAPAERPARKPRVLLAGEFSAGKTRLVNALLGAELLPSNVTATALPPVWLTGAGITPRIVALDGSSRELPGAGVEHAGVENAGMDLAGAIARLGADPAQTAFCLLPHGAPLLERIDLIDTPGNSDPNMPAESWQRMLDHADTVVWCSHAVQAWRQSEKAAFAELPEALRARATLLVTHADRLEGAGDLEKVQRRVMREAGGLFGSVMMVSLVRDADIARIREHLLGLAAQMLLLPGRDHPAVAEALAAAPRPGPVPDPARDFPPVQGAEAAGAATSQPGSVPQPRRIRVVTDILRLETPLQMPGPAPAQTPAQTLAQATAPAAPDTAPEAAAPVRPVRPEPARSEHMRPDLPARRQELRVIEGSREQAAPVLPAVAAAPAPAPARASASAPVPGTRNVAARPARPPAPGLVAGQMPGSVPERAPEPARPLRAREIWAQVTAGRRLNGPEAVSRALTDYFDEIDREFRRLTAGGPGSGGGDPSRDA